MNGIDYGNGLTNIDTETGIRYGVIHQGEVLQAWADDSEAHYTPACPYCGNELKKGFETRRCGHCHKRINPDVDFDIQEPDYFTYDADGYQCQQSADDTDIFVLKSPYFTYCQFCSPCAPGAGYLMDYFKPDTKYRKKTNPINNHVITYSEWYKIQAEDNRYIKAYCFGHDWYEDNKAPYPVFSVETGEIVNP